MNHIETLRAALQGVIKVADRDTDEFNAARAALASTAEPAQDDLTAQLAAVTAERDKYLDVLANQSQVGWLDEFGNVFPLAAWKPKYATYHDIGKEVWKPVYRNAIAATKGESK